MGALTTIPHDPLLDLDPWVGQRQATFIFRVTDAVTKEVLGEIHPLREPASLTHDTSSTIKRQLIFSLGTADTAAINPVSERISVYMKFPSGVEYPIGRYMFTDSNEVTFTSGRLGHCTLNDEMFIVDQEIRTAINGFGVGVSAIVAQVLQGLGIQYTIENSPFISTGSWGLGTHRGQILEDLATTGDFFSPWFDNHGIMRFIRTFDPARKVVDLDFDNGNKVMREGITVHNDLLNAPNIIVVTSNSSGNDTVPVTDTAFVAPNAPNSVANRGFEITKTYTMQLTDNTQAAMVAAGLAQRNTIFETVELTTAPDPRHDSYNVIKWHDQIWLETSWSMALVEGGQMNHKLRKAYLT